MSDPTFENLKASLSSLKVKEIQTCAQFCINISMYFIDKTVKTLAAHAEISTFHPWQNANLWPHFVWAIVQRHFDLLKKSWVSIKTWIIKYCWRFLKKINIFSSIGPNKSLKTGKFSLAQASVKWKFVTDAPDIFGLFLSPSRFCFQACR